MYHILNQVFLSKFGRTSQIRLAQAFETYDSHEGTIKIILVIFQLISIYEFHSTILQC